MRFAPLCAFAVLNAFTIAPADAGSFDAFYAFGDSLTDTGNVYTATSGTEPASPYFSGRFSNGPIWADDVAAALGLSVKPSLQGGTNYAYGGAESGVTPAHTTASFLDLLGPAGQLAQFTAAHPQADPNALYAIWIGSNDIEDLLVTNPTAAQAQADIAAIVANIDTSILDLATLGARNFLIVTVPDLGKTPRALALGPAASAAASTVSGLFDTTLVNGAGPLPSLGSLAAGAGLNVSVLDTFSLLDSVIANPSTYGFTNTMFPCLTGAINFAGGTVCSADTAVQNQFVFWDETHPTSAAQALVGAAALATVTPEPSSVVLSGGGLLLLCALMRRKFRRQPELHA